MNVILILRIKICMIILKHNYINKKIIFVHIPKSAGQSILEMIKVGVFNSACPAWLFIGNPNEFEYFLGAPVQDISKCNFLGGHISLNAFKNKLGDSFYDYYSFSIIRNPVDRAISLYSYILGNPDHFQHNAVRDMDIIDFIYSEYYPQNNQCYLFLEHSVASLKQLILLIIT
jgi:hypothetical protein